MSENEKPLITFLLFTFNQERFIEEAVKGALAQTYSPLEVVISDDCSTDRTFEIVSNLVAKYQGPHSIVLNQNERNLGIGAHINRAMEIAKGELIVGAAGDDISLPSRTSVLVKHWLDCNKKPCSLYSKSMVISADGTQIRELHSPPKPGTLAKQLLGYMHGVQGNSHAFSRKVFEQFGPILPNTVCEDRVIPLRSQLLGGIEYVPVVLVKYRVHDSNVSHYHWKEKADILNTTTEIHKRNINIYKNYVADLVTAIELDLLARAEFVNIQTILLREISKIQNKIDFLNGGVVKKISLIALNIPTNPKQSLRWAAMLLFPGLYIKSQKKNLGIS